MARNDDVEIEVYPAEPLANSYFWPVLTLIVAVCALSGGILIGFWLGSLYR